MLPHFSGVKAEGARTEASDCVSGAIKKEEFVMPPMIHVMMKPASGLCNMRCKYCFYADETEKREVANYGMMTEETVKNVIDKALNYASREVTFAFQGGEPTLTGLDFFRMVTAYVKEKNTKKLMVNYALQTNGLLLDDAWCAFFKDNHFLIGVSLDGNKELHDRNRVDAAGNGTYDRVVNGIRFLEKHGVDFNILTVLTSEVCRRFFKVYKDYDKNGWDYQQYIPCLDPLEEKRGGYPWSLSPDRFADYLKTAFDCWYRDAMEGHKKYHRYFDNLLLMLNGQPPEACGMGGRCGMQYVVEADGSVYPCDFYMLDPYRLGNLNEQSFEELDKKRSEIGFVEKSIAPDPGCMTCEWKGLCRGGCRRDRDYFEAGIGKNYFCSAYKEFFRYAYPRLKEVYYHLTRG